MEGYSPEQYGAPVTGGNITCYLEAVMTPDGESELYHTMMMHPKADVLVGTAARLRPGRRWTLLSRAIGRTVPGNAVSVPAHMTTTQIELVFEAALKHRLDLRAAAIMRYPRPRKEPAS